MEGEFKSFNQGELYLYNTDGPRHKLDTISVRNGRFTYQVEMEMPTTYVLVFPNFSEVPVLGEPGKRVTVEGDASHLKEMTVDGTEENKLMTAYRMQTNQQTPPEVRQTAIQFIKDHPQSLASRYILNKQFIQTPTPDYHQAQELLEVIAKDSPNSKELTTLKKQLEGLSHLDTNNMLPRFSATGMNGITISNSQLTGQVNVIFTLASWNYDSQNMMRKLNRLQKEHGDRLKVVSISLDASRDESRKYLDRDSVRWSCISDGRLWESPLLNQLGLYFVPDNIITDSRGKIVAHSVPTNDIDHKIEEMLRKQ